MGEARRHGNWCKWKGLIQWQMFCGRSIARHDFVHFSQFRMRPKIHYQRNAASVNIVILGGGETWTVEYTNFYFYKLQSLDSFDHMYFSDLVFCVHRMATLTERRQLQENKRKKTKIQTQCNDADLTTRSHRQNETFRCMRENLKLLSRTIFPRFRQLMRWHGAPSASRPASGHTACV